MKQIKKEILYWFIVGVAFCISCYLINASLGFDGYCQHQYSKSWLPNNRYVCGFSKFVLTRNSHDITLYANTPLND